MKIEDDHTAAADTTTCLLHIRGGGVVTGISDSESKCSELNDEPAIRFLQALPVPETLILHDWIAHYSLIQRGRWSGGIIDKEYLEKAVHVALSLATSLQRQHAPDSSGFLPETEICVDNVLVTTVEEDSQADFVQKSILPRYGWGAASYSQRIAICALGRVFFELFTLGDKPPRKNSNTALTTVAPLSLEHVQKLLDDDSGDSKKTAKKQARHEEEKEDEDAPYKLLQNAGLPHSICRLVSDMLENSGGLFSHDDSIATFSDCVTDLSQMAKKPKSFLHDTLVMRKPKIPNKLYCRDDSLKQCLDVAQQVVDSDSIFDRHSRSAIMLSGCSGSGKSRLVQEVHTRLGQKGWQYLYCKFDQAEGSNPLRKITSAIDRFLLDLTFDAGSGEEIRSRIINASNEEDLRNLFDVIPTLKQLVSADNNSSSIENIFDEDDSDSGYPKLDPKEVSNALASNFRLYRSCAMLLKAISSTNQPLIFCMDDLQWADIASVDLIYSLLVHIDQNINEESRLLLICCYRSDEECPMAVKIEDITRSSRVSVTNIALKALSPDDVNIIVGDALSYPRRLTRPLANLITQKTTGNPLYIKEFLNSLATENLLTFSLPRQKWHWDEDLIQVRTVSDNVAELLTRKLLRLSKHVFSSLSIMSCFGSEVPEKILVNVRDACDNPDVIIGLECAAAEGLVEKSKCSFRFSHDMIQQAVCECMEPSDRQKMLLEVAETLWKETGGGSDDTVLLIIAQCFNRVEPSFIASAERRARYAALNLRAAEKSIQVPDFNSVCEYVESGIKLLGDDNWKPKRYQLSLALFNFAAIGQWAVGNTTLMSKRINEVCKNGRVFEDKLEVLDVLVHSLGMDGFSASKSIEQCCSVLAHLGETFPSPIQNEFIVKELSETQCLCEKLVTSTENMSIMGHSLKIKAMKFLHLLLYISHQQKDKIFPLVACKMVRITLKFGLHEYSSVGLAGVALSCYYVFADIDMAYKLGKVAVKMANSSQGRSVFPEVSSIVHGMVNVWKEPLQATYPPLLEAYNMAKAGKMTTALTNAMLYTYRAYFSGSPLPELQTKMTEFLQNMAQHKRVALYLLMMPVSNVITAFCGGPAHGAWEGIGKCKADDENLKTAVETKEWTLYECIVALKMMRCFIFRDLDTAQKTVTKCLEIVESAGHGLVVHLATAYRVLYSGLIAFHCFRETLDRYWIDVGNSAIAKMESWSSQCDWSFSNKLLLLQAESLYALGEIENAAEKYNLAIESSQKHRFVHEEAIACELASLFHQKTSDQKLSGALIKRSIECYKTWGAQKKVDALITAHVHLDDLDTAPSA